MDSSGEERGDTNLTSLGTETMQSVDMPLENNKIDFKTDVTYRTIDVELLRN